MALDPQVQALLDLFRDQPPIQTLPVHVVRRAYTQRFDGLHHGSLSWVHAVDRASDAMQEICGWIRANARRT
jgi:hypothetical protein